MSRPYLFMRTDSFKRVLIWLALSLKEIRIFVERPPVINENVKVMVATIKADADGKGRNLNGNGTNWIEMEKLHLRSRCGLKSLW